MLIHELAERTGLAAHTIRFYEKQGLLRRNHSSRGANNYRHYSEEAISRLMFIKQGQFAGFTLAEIRALIDVWEGGEMSLDDQKALVWRKLEQLEQKIAELEQMRGYLRAKLLSLQAVERTAENLTP
jgi:MerR family Zn(II)-responsive transcriptional regulator of zntA